jgi:hypothetical protein
MNLPDNFNAVAFDDHYGDRPELCAPRVVHRIAALAEIARRMGFGPVAELLDEQIGEAIVEETNYDAEDRRELHDEVVKEARSCSDVHLTSTLLTAIGDHRIAQSQTHSYRAVGAVQAFIRGVFA